jgi:hypothetical protein
MKDLIQACNPLWASVIKTMNIDFFIKKVKIELVEINSEGETNHTLEMKSYESFLWLEKSKTTHDDYDASNYDYYELTSITFGNVQAKSDDRWLKEYLLDFNIVIEIWESALLVKASKVVVDGHEFQL